METFIETSRLILREITMEDDRGMLLLESDPEVHRFLVGDPVNNMLQVHQTIKFIRQQYIDNGIGRWAVVHKGTQEFLGWAGLKWITETINGHIHFHDLGYRFIRIFWGQGYATEATCGILKYAFEQIKLNDVFAITDVRNIASGKILQKSGFQVDGTFDYKGLEHNWYTINKQTWIDNSIHL